MIHAFPDNILIHVLTKAEDESSHLHYENFFHINTKSKKNFKMTGLPDVLCNIINEYLGDSHENEEDPHDLLLQRFQDAKNMVLETVKCIRRGELLQLHKLQGLLEDIKRKALIQGTPVNVAPIEDLHRYISGACNYSRLKSANMGIVFYFREYYNILRKYHSERMPSFIGFDDRIQSLKMEVEKDSAVVDIAMAHLVRTWKAMNQQNLKATEAGRKIRAMWYNCEFFRSESEFVYDGTNDSYYYIIRRRRFMALCCGYVSEYE